MPGLFFTGTDTGAGKTVVTAGVARVLRQQGREVRLSKPVATGASGERGRVSAPSGERVSAPSVPGFAEDTLRLAAAAGVSAWEELAAITPWTLAAPAAPPVAARSEGIRLSLAELREAVRRQTRDGALTLVEGVGGLLCPLTERETVADLARELGFPLIVVARHSLGTLNHTLLTLEVASNRGLAVAGVVVSETTPPEGLADETNIEELRRRMTVPLLAVVPHTASDGAAADALAAVDWWALGTELRNSPLIGG